MRCPDCGRFARFVRIAGRATGEVVPVIDCTRCGEVHVI